MPLHILALKVFSIIQRKCLRTTRRLYFRFFTSFSQRPLILDGPFFKTPNIDFLTSQKHWLVPAVAKIMSHQFDLLGSGSTQVVHGGATQGVHGHSYSAAKIYDFRDGLHLNKANRKYAVYCLSLLSPNYRPIDWQLDFKSGYRWTESQWWEDIPYGHLPGIDIKVPWELSRMQHLPLLAYAYQVAGKPSELSAPEVYADEFCSQILDFIANNPPRFGVNWKCPMDVAIRAANWLVALDLFRSAGYTFPSSFLDTFSSSLMDHGLFVEKNFEKGTDFRGNHYLADIAGLSFIAFYLEPTKIVQKWRDLCRRELATEAEYQFHRCGSNFEGSSAYHRLSTEMLFYPSLLLHLHPEGKPNFGEQFPKQLQGMSDFALRLTRPDGNIVQIGDNDSGRFLKLNPSFVRIDNSLIENHLDVSHLNKSIASFFGAPATDIESSIVAKSLAIRVLPPVLSDPSPLKFFIKKNWSLSPETAVKKQSYQLSLPPGYKENLESYCYREFGLVIYKSANFFLSFRCGPVGQLGRGGHDHDDQLSLELFCNEKPVILDPGTYLYTSIPEERNLYRSAEAHFSPQIKGRSVADLSKGLFFLSGAQPGELCAFKKDGCIGLYQGYGFPVVRKIKLQECLIIEDYFFADCEPKDLKKFTNLPYSKGYGLKEL